MGTGEDQSPGTHVAAVMRAIRELSARAPQRSVRFSRLVEHLHGSCGMTQTDVHPVMEAAVDMGMLEFRNVGKERFIRLKDSA